MGRKAMLVAVVMAGVAGPRVALADPDDYVVQQVCIDEADRAVLGDPVHCPHRRKLRIGEAIPYRRVDAGNWQALFSYPVEGLAGERRVVAEKIFGGNDATGSFSDLGARSGFDLIEIGASYVSGIRTSDPGGGDQIFWRTAACERADGWIFFPPGLAPGQHGEARSTLKITPGPSTECPALRNIAPDDTVWDHPVEPIRYTSGKLLDTITSEHFAYGDPSDPAHDNDSMEKFYFTREYGFSRWEAWETPAGCNKRAARAGQPAASLCKPSSVTLCNGPNTATYFGKLYLRLDCRDSTFYVADTEWAFDPLVNDAAPGDVLGRNLLTNGTFVAGQSGWTAGGGLQVDGVQDARTHNRSLRLTCAPCNERVLSQSFAVPGLDRGRVLRASVTLAATSDEPASGSVLLTFAPPGQPPRSVERPWHAGRTPYIVRFDIPWQDMQGQSTPARVEIRLDGSARVDVDDAYVALLGTTDR